MKGLLVGLTQWLKSALDEVLANVIGGFDPAVRVGMVLENANFPDKPLAFSFRRADQLNSTVMMATLEKVL
ncbi:hypothetical protein FQA39_LY18302 [Lamprigera yunnana]|nr:hypothetical protein FQA39_LY18302 [Lamprigera yunnana]